MLAKYGYLQWVFTLLLVVASNSFAGGWEQITELPTWRIGGTAAAVNGKIYLIGGYDDHENLGRRAPVLSTVDVYDTQTNTWHAAADMPTPRMGQPTAVFSNEIYVLGSYDRKGPRGAFRHKKNVEMYDTACVARPHPYPVHQKNRNVIYCFMSRKTLYSKLFDFLFAST